MLKLNEFDFLFMRTLIQTKSWSAAYSYFQQIKNQKILDFFHQNRLKNFSFDFEGIYFDFSKHHWDEKMLSLFVDLAEEMDLKKAINQFFDGRIINKTEQRQVLHTALRQPTSTPIYVSGENIIPIIKQTYQKIEKFVDKIISGQWKGITGKPITDIINIGIGGSDLGPKMMVQALQAYRNHLNIHYLSNIDPFQLDEILSKIDLETSLFVIVSKSFSTQETLTNARSIQQKYINFYGKKAISKHFVTVSTQVEKAEKFGIHTENIFPMWDWVGGRFSLWSPAGISIALAIGFQNFKKILQGAYQMDVHFRTTSLDKNLPVLAAFLTILYNNFFEYETEAYLPYSEKLRFLPDFLQQLLMESNGKSISLQNKKVDWQTGNIIFGNTGTNAQHSFFQLLHQGTKIVPVHFIAEKNNTETAFTSHHQILLANMLAQSESLMKGEKIEIPYKSFEGNRPSSVILLDRITPSNMGKLIAFYEHKTFVEAKLWQINAFDQFGVELGKKMTNRILKSLKNNIIPTDKDLSTKELIKRIQN